MDYIFPSIPSHKLLVKSESQYETILIPKQIGIYARLDHSKRDKKSELNLKSPSKFSKIGRIKMIIIIVSVCLIMGLILSGSVVTTLFLTSMMNLKI